MSSNLTSQNISLVRTDLAVASLVCAVIACGRVGFDPLGDGTDATLPPDAPLSPLESFTAVPHVGGLEGEILLTFQRGADTRPVARLEIIRVPGDIAPADCAGEPALILAELAVASTIDRVSDRWYRTHSYRACLYGADGVAVTGPTMVAERVGFYNPGPGCQQPPCAYPNSSQPTNRTFRRQSVLNTAGSTGGDVILSDLDGDDHLDVVVAALGQNFVHYGTGDGEFGPAIALSLRSLDTRAAVTGDFNRDGLQDIVVANTDGPSYVHFGLGDRAFDDGRAISQDVYPEMFDVAAADLNGDTALDLVFTRYGARDLIYLGGGDGGFSLRGEVKPEDNFSCVNCLQIQDIDRDEIPDLIMAYNTGTTRLDILRGNGDGTFSDPFEVPYGALTPISVKLADLDNDGALDIVVGRSLDGAVYISLGDGAGAFTDLAPLNTTTSSRCYGLAANDFDGDGHADIIFSQDNNGVIGALFGAGDGTFAAQVELDGGATWTTTNIDVGDVNGDGRLDFVMGVADGPSQLFLGQ